MSESTIKGAIAEAAITAEAVELGFVVSRPVIKGRRYDLIVDSCQQLKRCFYVPISAVAGQRAMHLRFAPTANNQRTAINFADDHPLGAIAQLGERSAGSRKVGGSNPPSSTS